MEELINETKTGLRNEKTTSKPKIFNARASIIKTTKPSYANQALKQIPNAFCLESTSKSVLSSLKSQNSDIAYESLQKKSEVMYKNVRNLPTEKIKTSVEVVYNRADNLYRMKVMRKTLST